MQWTNWPGSQQYKPCQNALGHCWLYFAFSPNSLETMKNADRSKNGVKWSVSSILTLSSWTQICQGIVIWICFWLTLVQGVCTTLKDVPLSSTHSWQANWWHEVPGIVIWLLGVPTSPNGIIPLTVLLRISIYTPHTTFTSQFTYSKICGFKNVMSWSSHVYSSFWSNVSKVTGF